MSCCPGHHRHPPPATSCYCQPPPCQPLPTDPILLQTVISHLLQNPQTQHEHHPFYQHHPQSHPSPPTNLQNCCSCECGQSQQYYPNYQNHPRKHKKKHANAALFPPSDPHQTDARYYSALVASLCQRIETLELCLHRISSSSSSFSVPLSLRDVAARTIQTHFRAYLVRRSRALGELKELASVKSRLNVLKSTLSIRKRIDLGSLSREVTDLILRLETVEGNDQMVRDSKRSISWEIDQLLELMDEFFLTRHQFVSTTVKSTKLTRNDDSSRLLYASSQGRKVVPNPRSGGVKDSKSRNLNKNELKLIENLRERVERINSMTRTLEGGEGSVGVVGRTGRGGKNYSDHHMKGNALGKNAGLHSNGKKRVGFLDNGNVTWVYDSNDEDSEEKDSMRMHLEEEEEGRSDGSEDSSAALADNKSSEKAEEADEDEAIIHGEEGGHFTSSQAGGDSGRSLGRNLEAKSDEVLMENSSRQNGKFVFAAPDPLKTDNRAGLPKKQHGVKIIG